MHSAEIQEKMKLANSFPLQMSTTKWKKDFFKIKLYTEKELWENYMTSCVKHTFLLLLVLLKILASWLEFFLTA